MFEMRPYAKRNNSLYNPFRDMDEFEKKFFSMRLMSSRPILRTRATAMSWKPICRALTKRTFTLI